LFAAGCLQQCGDSIEMLQTQARRLPQTVTQRGPEIVLHRQLSQPPGSIVGTGGMSASAGAMTVDALAWEVERTDHKDDQRSPTPSAHQPKP